MFDKDELKEVKSWMKEIRLDRKEIAETKYDDVAAYCVARHEDTINLLLGMSKFIEDNIALCQNPGDCLLVTDRKHTEEILVMPWHERHVRYAALRPLIKLL